MRKLLFIALFGIFIILATLAALFFFQDPNQVINNALSRVGERPSQNFVATLKLSNAAQAEQLLGEKATIEVTTTGVLERHQDSLDSLDTEVQLTAETDSFSLRTKAKVIFIENAAYFRITQAPPTFPALVDLKGLWVELPRGGDNNQENDTEELNFNFSEAEKKGTVKIDGITTNIYEASASPEALVIMLDSVAKVLGTKLTGDQIQSIKDGISRTASVPVKMWITPWTRDLKKISIEPSVSDNSDITLVLDLQGSESLAKVKKPEGALTLEDVLK